MQKIVSYKIDKEKKNRHGPYLSSWRLTTYQNSKIIKAERKKIPSKNTEKVDREMGNDIISLQMNTGKTDAYLLDEEVDF